MTVMCKILFGEQQADAPHKQSDAAINQAETVQLKIKALTADI